MENRVDRLITIARVSLDRASLCAGKIDAVLTIILTLFVSYSVFVRYVLNSPLWWVEEIMAYIWIYIAALSFPYATMLESHVASDIISARFPARLKHLITILGYVMAFMVCIVMVVKGITTTWFYYVLDWRSDTLLEAPLWIVWVSVPVGFCLMGFQVLLKLYAITQRLFSTEAISTQRS